MAFLSDIFGAGGVANLLGKVADVVKARVPDVNLQAQLQGDMEKLLATQNFSLAQGQLEVNKIEAASTNWFVAGARPAVLWVCVLGLLYQFVLLPFLIWGSLNFKWTPPPSLELGTLNTLLFGLLGLSGLRTAEKFKGVSGKH